MTTALLTGISGQDGWYLARHLHKLGYQVVGARRGGRAVADLPFVQIESVDLADRGSVERVIDLVQPDEVYHLGASSSVSASWLDPLVSSDVNGLGTLRLLEAIRTRSSSTRLFLASSSEVFGHPTASPQDEMTPWRPTSPYGASKAFASALAEMYRERYGLFVSVGILYNHESPRRPDCFVTRKITKAVAAIARGEQQELRLGNLDAVRDWGYAGDFVVAYQSALTLPEPSDFVLATGSPHSVRDWCVAAFARAGLNYEDFVVTDPEFWRAAESISLVGNPGRARQLLKWEPEASFEDLVHMMVDADLDASRSPSQ